MSGASGSAARVGSATRSSRPDASSAISPTAARTAVASRNNRRAGARNASPALVSVTRRPSRWNSATPSSRSSVATPLDSDGWVTWRAAAARVKPPWSTTATTYSTCRSSIGTAYVVDSRYQLDVSSRKASNRDVELHLLLAVAAVGMLVGFLGGVFGKGGSSVATPLLAAIGVPPIAALASPLPAILPATFVSA